MLLVGAPAEALRPSRSTFRGVVLFRLRMNTSALACAHVGPDTDQPSAAAGEQQADDHVSQLVPSLIRIDSELPQLLCHPLRAFAFPIGPLVFLLRPLAFLLGPLPLRLGALGAGCDRLAL